MFGDGEEQQRSSLCDPNLRWDAHPDGHVTIKELSTGETFRVWPVDAREAVESGLWEIVPEEAPK